MVGSFRDYRRRHRYPCECLRVSLRRARSCLARYSPHTVFSIRRSKKNAQGQHCRSGTWWLWPAFSTSVWGASFCGYLGVDILGSFILRNLSNPHFVSSELVPTISPHYHPPASSLRPSNAITFSCRCGRACTHRRQRLRAAAPGRANRRELGQRASAHSIRIQTRAPAPLQLDQVHSVIGVWLPIADTPSPNDRAIDAQLTREIDASRLKRGDQGTPVDTNRAHVHERMISTRSLACWMPTSSFWAGL